MMSYRAIIFDWDGVITDSVNIKTQAFCELYHEYGDTVVNQVKEYHLAHGGTSRFDKFRYFHKHFLNITLDETEVQILAEKFSQLVFDLVIKAPYIKGALETIVSEYEKGTLLFVVSGTPTDEIIAIAQARNVSRYFREILGSPEKKPAWVKYILNKYTLDPDKCLFIGDANEDYYAALENGLHFLGISPTADSIFPAGTLVKQEVIL